MLEEILEEIEEKIDKYSFDLGREAMFEELNTPMDVIIKPWNPSECPRCKEDFYEFEPCVDGYYKRAYSMDRCPHCGQKLHWNI